MPSKHTVDEIRSMKKDAEFKILEILNDLEGSLLLSVSDIVLTKHQYMIDQTPRTVDIEINLEFK